MTNKLISTVENFGAGSFQEVLHEISIQLMLSVQPGVVSAPRRLPQILAVLHPHIHTSGAVAPHSEAVHRVQATLVQPADGEHVHRFQVELLAACETLHHALVHLSIQ